MIIAGNLTNSVGGIVQWSTITFDPATGPSISFSTDGEGNYSYEVPAGTYRVFIKGKYDITQELLGENVAVVASGTMSLDSLLDQGTTVPVYTAETLPDPTPLAAGATVVLTGNFAPDVMSVLLRVDYVKGVKSWTGTVVSANDPVDADGLPDGVTWVKV